MRPTLSITGCVRPILGFTRACRLRLLQDVQTAQRAPPRAALARLLPGGVQAGEACSAPGQAASGGCAVHGSRPLWAAGAPGLRTGHPPHTVRGPGISPPHASTRPLSSWGSIASNRSACNKPAAPVAPAATSRAAAATTPATVAAAAAAAWLACSLVPCGCTGGSGREHGHEGLGASEACGSKEILVGPQRGTALCTRMRTHRHKHRCGTALCTRMLTHTGTNTGVRGTDLCTRVRAHTHTHTHTHRHKHMCACVQRAGGRGRMRLNSG